MLQGAFPEKEPEVQQRKTYRSQGCSVTDRESLHLTRPAGPLSLSSPVLSTPAPWQAQDGRTKLQRCEAHREGWAVWFGPWSLDMALETGPFLPAIPFLLISCHSQWLLLSSTSSQPASAASQAHGMPQSTWTKTSATEIQDKSALFSAVARHFSHSNEKLTKLVWAQNWTPQSKHYSLLGTSS